MALSCGIVGLPNVGKSTIFNALTRSAQALAANYPFATIEPNVGEVQEIDARPSDGIALALRMQAPIFVSDKIALEETVPDKAAEPEDATKFKKFIDELKPSDFMD